MNKRITLIALFDESSLKKLQNALKNINKNLCKVPFREDNREQKDTLPFHSTFSVWNEDKEFEAIEILRKLKLNEIKLKITGTCIKESYNNSWNLYFDFERNQDLYKLQNEIYNLSKNEKYNPKTFIPHITIHCDKNYKKLLDIKDLIMSDFKEFEVSFNSIGLFKIYPAELIEIR